MAKKAEIPQDDHDPDTGEVFEQVTLKEVAEHLAEMRARDTAKVFEWPDPRPLEPPLGYNPQPSLTEQIRNMVRSEHLRLAAMESGMESFEEADDFDVGDEYDPTSPYELYFDPPVVAPEVPQTVSGEPGRGGGGAEPPSGKQNGDPVGGSPSPAGASTEA